MVGDASVARQTLDVGVTRTLTRLAVTSAAHRIRSEQVADARGALLVEGVAEESGLAHLAAESFRVEQTLLALAGARVAVARTRQVDVVVALARTALTSGHFRIAKIVIRTDVASRSGVSFLTLAHHVLRLHVQRAPGGVRVAGFDGSRTRAGPARDVHSETRIAVVSVQAAVAVEFRGEVATFDAFAGARVAPIGVTVALAPLTGRKVPESGLALVACAAVSVGPATALSAAHVAKVVQRSDRITLARSATFRTESVRSRSALVAFAAHDVRFALALAACSKIISLVPKFLEQILMKTHNT